MARLVIAGYYGFANTGDEALLSAIISSLRTKRPGLDIIVLSANPRATEAYHGVRAISRWNLTQVADVLRQADLFISGGGTLLQDSTSLRSLTYYAGLMLTAHRLGTRVMVYANGIGPLHTRMGRLLARRALLTASYITLRDARAAADLQDLIGPLPIPVEVTADPALALPPPPPGQGRNILHALGVPVEKPLVALSLRPWDAATPVHWQLFARTADAIVDLGCTVLFCPLQYGPDAAVSRQVMAAMRQSAHLLPSGLTPQDFLAVLGEMDLVAGMRLHALILAAARGVPVAGVVYDPKVEGFLQEVNQPILGYTTNLADDLTAKAVAAVAGRDSARARLLPILATLREKAEQNADIALSLLP